MAITLDWKTATELTDTIDWLKQHRDWIEANNAGFGDRALNWMWLCLLHTLPDSATLMEIGVFKGQTISLWGLIGQKLNKQFDVYGLTKLDTEMIDKYHKHDPVPLKTIEQTLKQFGAKAQIIDADSRDDVPVPAFLDLLFVDGGHDYETVVSDIAKYVPSVKPGGLIVFDDVEPEDDYGHWYRGLDDVTRAVNEFAAGYEEVLRCGYVRCYRAK